MKQTYEDNKRRIQTFKLTADVKDDNGVVHHFFEGYEYVEIGGLKWATCNVGAEKETDSGLYFAWGETVGYKDVNEKHFTWEDYKFGKYCNLLKYNNNDGLDTLEACDDAATKNMGRNWRTPTYDEYRTLLFATTNKCIRVNGVNGWLFTDKTDESKELFFPTIGHCNNGSVNNAGFYGYYWSSSSSTLNLIIGWVLFFGNRNCFIGCCDRYFGFPIRGVAK